VRNTASNESLILVERLPVIIIRSVIAYPTCTDAGMGVGRGHQDILFFHSRMLVNEIPGMIQYFPYDGNVVGYDNGDLFMSIVQNEAFGIKLVVDILSFGRGPKIPNNTSVEERSYITHCCSGTQFVFFLLCSCSQESQHT